ncbi:hypothetical protein CWS31_013455 [Colwellia echini]|uniref:Outer membrane protein beta-barrel domain-containing protein n=1 Tax=Colwellia echini TaxID=1982103 RepID=A0ABY3MUI8_9GAMM|nr:hypothetical protein CWS31_013455 [Colwellia echini]
MTQVLSLIALFSASQSYALEGSVQLQKPNQDKSYGYSLVLGDEFFNQKAFNWQVSYNRLENVAITDLDETSQTWDDANLDFTLQTIELGLSYRYYPRSYDKLISSLMIEFQVAAAVNLSEHKLVFRPTLDRDDIYFANQGDINPVMSVMLQKSFTKNSAIQLGLKYYPSYSDFGSISTLYLGYNYRFGRQIGY